MLVSAAALAELRSGRVVDVPMGGGGGLSTRLGGLPALLGRVAETVSGRCCGGCAFRARSAGLEDLVGAASNRVEPFGLSRSCALDRVCFNPPLALVPAAGATAVHTAGGGRGSTTAVDGRLAMACDRNSRSGELLMKPPLVSGHQRPRSFAEGSFGSSRKSVCSCCKPLGADDPRSAVAMPPPCIGPRACVEAVLLCDDRATSRGTGG